MIKKIIALVFMVLSSKVLALPTAKFTLLVVDEYGIPIQGANASLSFMKPKKIGWGGDTYYIEGKTDKKGFYSGAGATQRYTIYGADAKGYYGTSFDYKAFTGVSGVLGFRKWQPWNPTLKVVLKKIKNPIAMYAYSTNWIDIPKNNEFIGYDLVKHDWVSPYGKGVVKDFLFKITYSDNSDSKIRNFSLNFPNALDGIQPFLTKDNKGSALNSAHQAPENDYKSTLIQERVWKNGRSTSTYRRDDGTNYYFRVRCDNDKPDSCLYGKIYGNIEFGKNILRLQYYLNPSIGDTNIEFDPKQNLFKGFKRTLHSMSKP